MKSANWTPEDDAKLIGLLNGKRSAAEIGGLLGRSRMSVCGRVDRMKKRGKLPNGASLRPADTGNGRPRREGGAKKNRDRQPQAIKAKWRDRPPIVHDEASSAGYQLRFADGYLDQTGHLSFNEIRRGVCKFPIDQPAGPSRYCGLEAEKGGSWCPHHAARVFMVKIKGMDHGPDH